MDLWKEMQVSQRDTKQKKSYFFLEDNNLSNHKYLAFSGVTKQTPTLASVTTRRA
jgi:hypothetical protein